MTKPIEVIHIVRQYKPSVGGLEDAVLNLCTHLARYEGIKVRIITLDRLFSDPLKLLPKHEILDGISVTRLSYFGSSRYPIALSVLREIQSADIVHVHAIDFFFDFLALTKVFHQKQLVASTHGGFFHTSFASTLKKIYFRTITRMSCWAYKTLCASSENDAATFRRIAPHKVVTIENGVNIDKWKNAGSITPQRTMIFIGRWSANKAVPVLIELLSVLKRKGNTWKLIIAGVPAHETVESLKVCAERFGVGEHVTIRLKPEESELSLLIHEASYIASASTYEGFGISIIEGLSAGLLPLVSPIPPFEKLRLALGAGSVIDATNLEQTAQDMEQLHAQFLAAPASYRERCMNMAQQYNWEGVTHRVAEVYQQMIRK